MSLLICEQPRGNNSLQVETLELRQAQARGPSTRQPETYNILKINKVKPYLGEKASNCGPDQIRF